MRRRLLIGPMLVLLTLAVYWPVAEFQFVIIDDPLYVTENPHVLRGLSWDNVDWAIMNSDVAMWHPLTWLSLMLDVELFGLQPGGFHLINLLLHIANTLLLYAVLKQMTAAIWQSALVAALFAIHPLHVESVAWITERKDVLSLFFGLWSLWAYTLYARRPSKTWYLLSLSAFTLSVLAKPMLVTLPFLLLVLDCWPLQRVRFSGDDTTPADNPLRSWRLLLIEKIPFLIPAILCSVLTFLTEQHGGALPSLTAYPPAVRLCNAVVVYVLYILQMFWPVNLAVYYPHPGAAIPMEQVLGAASVLTIITIAAWYARRRHPYLLVGWLWYLGTLLPMIGLVQVGAYRMADRFTYFPLIGLFIAIAWLLASLVRNGRGQPVVITAVVLAVLGALTWSARIQAAYWRNSELLFRRAIAVTENNALAHNNLGLALDDQGRFAEAIEQFQIALSVDPQYHAAHNNWGTALHQRGRHEEALVQFESALRIRPEDASAHVNRGLCLHTLGRYEDAAESYQDAIRHEPRNAHAHNNYGITLYRLRRYGEALEQFQLATKHNPDLANAHNNLGNILNQLKRPEEAEHAFERALEIQPDYANAHANLATALLQLSRTEEAIQHFREAVRINPQHAAARKQIELLTQ